MSLVYSIMWIPRLARNSMNPTRPRNCARERRNFPEMPATSKFAYDTLRYAKVTCNYAPRVKTLSSRWILMPHIQKLLESNQKKNFSNSC